MNREVTMELLEKYGKEFVQDRATALLRMQLWARA